MKKIIILAIIVSLFSSCNKTEEIKPEESYTGVVTNTWEIDVSTWKLTIPESISKNIEEQNTGKNGEQKEKTTIKKDEKVDEKVDKEVQELTNNLFNDLSTMVENEK